MLYVFKCWDVSTPAAAAHSQSLFQTGWFVESLLTQTLVIHVIRTNKIPFLQSRPSALLMVMGGALPLLYWPYLALTLFCYVLLTQGFKAWLVRRHWI